MAYSPRHALLFANIFLVVVLFPVHCNGYGRDTPAIITLQSSLVAVRAQIVRRDKGIQEVIQIEDRGAWLPALVTYGTLIRLKAANSHAYQTCKLVSITSPSGSARIVIEFDCGVGRLTRTLAITSEPDVLHVYVRFVPNPNTAIQSVEDRYFFVPCRSDANTALSGPLDFVWSQNVKSESDDLMPQWTFKSPAVMFQQGRVFAALMPDLSRFVPPVAFDMDVTSGEAPWFSYGMVPSKPHGHSYFRRSSTSLSLASGPIEYSYDIVASAQPPQLGYRRVVHRLWQTLGRPRLQQSTGEQRNLIRPELASFDEWRQEAWHRYADSIYHRVDCPARDCGTLTSDRNYRGAWDEPQIDAWFNSWFQSLRTAYGWYFYGRRSGDVDIQKKAESVLNLALSSPQQKGAFSTIYLLRDQKWIRDDGWAGFADDYHAFCMSWTAYWMIKWAEDLVPQRKNEILKFVSSYGDFIVKHQLSSGVIPSWYNSEFQPRPEFRDFNAETAGSALLLAELGRITGRQIYIDSAARAMDFVAREVVPRRRWFDFETFISCARKPLNFYDSITAQYPQNNLSMIQAAKAYLVLYRVTKDRRWLGTGTEVLDYFLLTQQLWSPPSLTPNLLGGFTTQNTDAEWSDARQAYAAVLLFDYYQETRYLEYLERAVAAARATFPVAPWENWAHTGFINEHGAMTGFHWGTGSAMTSVEIMSSTLGDVYIDLARKEGVGFNGTTVKDLKVEQDNISVVLDTIPELSDVDFRFTGGDPRATYRVTVNGSKVVTVKGADLARVKYILQPPSAK